MAIENKQLQNERSLAGQISRHWTLHSALNYFIMDIITALVAVLCWCANSEFRAQGDIVLSMKRGFVSGSGSLYNFIADSYYVFGENSAPSGTFFLLLMLIIAAMIVCQLFMLLASTVRGSKTARRILKPIREIAASVNMPEQDVSVNVSAAADNAEEHHVDHDFSDLRTAIDRMDPMMSTSHIHTGNSDLEELEDAVNSLLDRMRESYSRQAQFVSDASHELRTPIAVIKGYADMLERWGKSDPEVLNESITAIKNESEHMGRLAEQLLFLARGDNGRQTVNMDIFSLSDLVNEVCSEYRVIDSAHRYNTDIRGSFKAYGDISLIKQAIRILTDNAKKYTPEGGEITLGARRNVQGEICFDVMDTGIGMEQSDIEHIFERFYRADPARNRDTGGTGLGLAIAKWIVDKHNGRFEISSCVGIGTKMTVVLKKINPDSAEFILNEEKKSRSRSFIARSLAANSQRSAHT